MTQLTITELNERNRWFWEGQNALRDRRMADQMIRETAYARAASELARVPIRHLASIEKLLEEAEGDKQRFLSLQGRRGGQAKGPDALGQAILDLVRKEPGMTVAELQGILTRERFPRLIEDVEDETIWFVQPDGSKDGQSKKAPISGLKDRLSRAKKTLKSR
jgi:hypothetical protein